MFHHYSEYEQEWRKHHRRNTDERSLTHQIVELCILLAALFMMMLLIE